MKIIPWLVLINGLRTSYNLTSVSINQTVQNVLSTYNDTFFFSKSMNQTYTFNLVNVDPKYEDVSQRTRQYNGYFIKPGGFTDLFHDTMAGDDITSIIKFRVGQKNCLDFKKCSNTTFNEFSSCMKEPYKLIPSTKCSWASFYLPYMLLPDLTQIGYKILNVQGPAVPTKLRNKQNKVFWFYGNHKRPKVDYLDLDLIS